MAEDTPPLLLPEEAIAFFRAKGIAFGFDWRDVWQEEHAKAFTVAKAMSRDLLEDIRQAVDDALVNGTTLATFRQQLTPLLMARGWWGRSLETDPLTGEQRVVQLGSPARLRTIFDTNLRSAYAAGRWERIQRQKRVFPFLIYESVKDGRERPEHGAWHKTILPVDDPWWDTHYPPCGWNCRCIARPADAAHAQAVIDTTLAVQNGTELFIDYDHQSVLAVPQGGTAKAAGWVKGLTVEADGIHAQVEWTAAAHQALEAGEYRYISPHFRFAQKDGRITRLVNAGLTNSPNFDLAAIASADMDADEADDDTEGDTKKMAKFAQALGLSDDAGEEEILAAIKDVMERSTAQASALASARSALGLADDADGEAIAAAASAKAAGIDPAQFVPRASYDALAKTIRENAEASAIAAVDQAVADGKVPPAQRDWALDLAKKDLGSFHSFLDAAVPFAAGDMLNKQPEGAGKHTALTEDEAIACEMTGMSPEDFLAAKNKGTN